MPPTPRQRLQAALAPDARKMMLDACVPEAIRRSKRWELVLLLAYVAVFFTYMVLWECGVIGHLPTPAFFGLIMLPLIVGFSVWRHTRRTLRRAAAHDHLLCPECLYDLRTLDAAGTCPECGRAYEHGGVRATWVDAEQRLRRGRHAPLDPAGTHPAHARHRGVNDPPG